MNPQLRFSAKLRYGEEAEEEIRAY